MLNSIQAVPFSPSGEAPSLEKQEYYEGGMTQYGQILAHNVFNMAKSHCMYLYFYSCAEK